MADRPASPIVPSARTLAALALLAPLAVLVAAIAPALWLAVPLVAFGLLALAMLDGWRAGRLIDLRIDTPASAEVGRGAPLRATVEMAGGAAPAGLRAAIGFDPILGESGRLDFPLSPATEPDIFTGEGALLPLRRGSGDLHGLWLRWHGRFGLARRQAYLPLSRKIRVLPDIAPVRSPALQTVLRDAQFGLVARRLRGEGTQFEALSEYQPGMDRRHIDWKASARHTRLFAREYEAERDNQIVFAFDCGQAMSEPVDRIARIDRAISAGLTAAYVALRGGDRVALYGFADRPRLATPFTADTRDFHRLRSAAADLDYSPTEPNFTLALATLAARLDRRSLIVLFSEFTDSTSAELMIESVERLVRHHVVIFVTMEDTELAELERREPASLSAIAGAVTAHGLARQRALVLERLRRLGVDVIEAPWQAIGNRLIDRYLRLRRIEAIG